MRRFPWNYLPLCGLRVIRLSISLQLILFFSLSLTAQYQIANSRTLAGQQRKINVVKIDPRGLLIATASSEGVIKVWDIKQGNVKFKLHQHALAVNALDFSPDGKYLVSASDDGSVIIWDMFEGDNVADIENLEEVTALLFIDDNSIVCGTRKGELLYLEWRKGKRRLRHASQIEDATSSQSGGAITALAYSEGRKVLFAGSEKGYLNLWDYQKRRLAEQNPIGDIINSIDLTKEEDKMTVALDNGLLCSWDVLKYNSKITRMNTHNLHDYSVKGVHFIGTTSYALSISTDGYLKIWNTEEEEQLYYQQIEFDSEDLPHALDIAENGDFVVVGGETGTLKIFEIRQIALAGTRESAVSEKPTKGPQDYERKGRDIAVFFAVQNYPWHPLQNPISDAESLAQALNHKYGFDTTILRNPTKDAIRSKIQELLNKPYSEEDQLLIFFSGHGAYKNYRPDSKKGEGFFIPSNAKQYDPYKDSYLSYGEILRYVNDSKCKHILLMMDACYSGALINFKGRWDRGRKGEWSQRKKLIYNTMPYTTRLAITSGDIEKTSDGGEHSPFTKGFLAGLASNGGKDKVLTFSELYTYLEILDPKPQQGHFGKNDPNSSFLFILVD